MIGLALFEPSELGVIRTVKSMLEKFLRWFGGIGADSSKPGKPSLPPAGSASDDAAGTGIEGTRQDVEAGEGGRDVAPPAATPAPRSPVTPAAEIPSARVAAGDKVDDGGKASLKARSQSDAQISVQASPVASGPPDQEEIQRRRELVRTLFNDFWSGRDDKPAAFVDRLNEAETYLNERLTASGETWRLDGGTRKMLGLPPRSHSRDDASAAAHR
jgi:hypothetical protein